MLQGPELDLMSESFSDEFGNPDGYSHKLIYLQWNLHKMNFGTPLQWSKIPSCKNGPTVEKDMPLKLGKFFQWPMIFCAWRTAMKDEWNLPKVSVVT